MLLTQTNPPDAIASSAIAHCTPLTVVHGYLDMMEPEDNQEWAPMVDEMRKQSQRMNDLLIEDVVLIPVVWRNGVRAVSHRLHGMELSDWDSDFWDLAYWYREA